MRFYGLDAEPFHRIGKRLRGPLDVRSDDDAQFLDGALLDLRKQVVKGDLAHGGHFGGALFVKP